MRESFLGSAVCRSDAGRRAGDERRVAWPSILGYKDGPSVDPRGRYVALAFANPAWGDSQAMDVWVLDTETAELTQVPSMPALLGLKFTSHAWTHDGRLVLLGEDDRGAFVAVWRPGDAQLALKRVKLPRRGSGSDSFAILG